MAYVLPQPSMAGPALREPAACTQRRPEPNEPDRPGETGARGNGRSRAGILVTSERMQPFNLVHRHRHKSSQSDLDHARACSR